MPKTLPISENSITSATEILPGLWIGDIEDAGNNKFYEDHEIDIVINCSKDIPFNEKAKVRRRIPVDDSKGMNVEVNNRVFLRYIDPITKFIHESLGKGKNVFVHCYAGRQRSATVICSYLIRYGGFGSKDVVPVIQSKRPICYNPYTNFQTVLENVERIFKS